MDNPTDYEPTAADYGIDLIFNALFSGMTIDELAEVVPYAETMRDMSYAVNLLGLATPDPDPQCFCDIVRNRLVDMPAGFEFTQEGKA